MTDQNVDLALILDRCLGQLAAGQDLERCLDAAGTHRDEIEPLLRAAARLAALRDLRPSDQQLATVEARVMADIEGGHKQAVTAARLPRLLTQKRQVDWARQPRRYSMTALVSALALVLAIACGGTVEASQSALPGQPLYRVKTLAESARLAAAGDDAARLQLQLSFADERLAEMEQLANRGADTALAVAAQAYTNHADAAAAYCAAQGELDCEQLLIRLQEQQQTLLRVQQRLQAETGADSEAVQAIRQAVTNCEALQLRTRDRLQQHGSPRVTATATEAGDGESVPEATVTPGANGDATRERERERVQTCTVTPSCTPVADGSGDQERNRAGQDDAQQPTDTPVADGSGDQERNRAGQDDAQQPTDTPAAVAPTVTPLAQQEQEQNREREQNAVATSTPAAAEATPAQNQERNETQAGPGGQGQEQVAQPTAAEAAAPTPAPTASAGNQQYGSDNAGAGSGGAGQQGGGR